MIRSNLLPRAGLLATLLVAAAAQGQALPTYPTTNGAPSTTEWAVDRYAPARFENGGSLFGRQDVLVLGVNEADGPGNRPQAFAINFFNTQGRRLRLLNWSDQPYSLIASLRVPSEWSSSTGLADSRRTDMWSVLTPDGVEDSAQALFGIVGFTNEGVAPAAFRQPEERLHLPGEYTPQGGGSGRYRVFDNGAGGWQEIALPVRYDAWTDFCVTFRGDVLEYRIDGALVYSDTTLTVPIGGVPTPVEGVLEVLMQAQNYGERPTPPGGVAGVTYDTHWSSLAAGAGECASVAVGGGFAADVGVSKSVAPSSVAPGQNAVFTLQVNNAGPGGATGVVAVDTLPPQLAYVSNTCGATFSAPELTWTIGNLASGQTVSCSLTVTVNGQGSFQNQVVVSGDEIDPVLANNTAVATVSGLLASPPLSIPANQWMILLLLTGLFSWIGLRRLGG